MTPRRLGHAWIAPALALAFACAESSEPERPPLAAEREVVQPLPATPPTAPQATERLEPDVVFLLLGQSNMVGRAFVRQADRRPIPCALLLDVDGRWEPARHPLNRYATDPLLSTDSDARGFGPGGSFAATLCQHLPGIQVGLVVNARSASGIGAWAKGERLYEHTIERASQITGRQVAGVLWHQGEANYATPSYGGQLARLIGNLRRDLGNPNLLFVAGEVTGNSRVNAQLAELPQSVARTAVVSADGLTTFDRQHFDHRSQVELGRRYALAVLELMSAPPRRPGALR